MNNQKIAVSPQHFALIDQAVKKSFSNTAWIAVELLTRGLSSAALYKLQINDRYYVARIDDPNHPHNNLVREYHAMETAAQRQIAPKVYHADPDLGIVMMDFIAQNPLPLTDYSKPEHVEAFARLIRDLHNGAAFKEDISIFQRVETVFNIINTELKKSSHVLQCMVIKNKLEKLLDDKNDIKPTHCDINPFNILFDGKRFWLVDWNAASQQNFYFDLATCVVFFYFYSVDAGNKFLMNYFSRPLTVVEKNKFSLMKIFVEIYFGVMFIYLSGLQNYPLLSSDEIDSLPDYSQYMSMLGQGIERLDNPLSQQKFGFIFLKMALGESKALLK